MGTFAELANNLERLLQYHMVLIPCGPSDVPGWLKNQQTLQNLRAYVAAGGGLFFTGWEGTYSDVIFPAQLKFAGPETPAQAYNANTNQWNTQQFRDITDSEEDVDDAWQAVAPDLAAWLFGQLAHDRMGMHREIVDSKIWGGSLDAQIQSTHEVVVGLDANGQQVIDRPRILVGAGNNNGDRLPPGVLFRPAGCDRVMYSIYETSHDHAPHSDPVERVLMYSMMELSVCEDAEPPVVVQPPPPEIPPPPAVPVPTPPPPPR